MAQALQWDAYSAQCPTRFALDRIADKWSVLIVSLLPQGPMRFNAILREVQGISQKVLSQTLKGLERDGLVTRTAFATVPVTVEYTITPLGQTLAISLTQVIAWAEHNMSSMLLNQKAYDRRTKPKV